jgi:hypothetical protein
VGSASTTLYEFLELAGLFPEMKQLKIPMNRGIIMPNDPLFSAGRAYLSLDDFIY